MFVTAAGAGIGLVAARASWREGGTVWATDRSPAKMPDWPEGPRGIVRSVDVTEDADFAEQGITAVAVCPGVVDTPSMQRRIEESDDPEGARKISSHATCCAGSPCRRRSASWSSIWPRRSRDS